MALSESFLRSMGYTGADAQTQFDVATGKVAAPTTSTGLLSVATTPPASAPVASTSSYVRTPYEPPAPNSAAAAAGPAYTPPISTTAATGPADTPPISTTQAITDLYTGIERKNIDQEGLDYWTSQVDTGAMSLADVEKQFSTYTPEQVAAADAKYAPSDTTQAITNLYTSIGRSNIDQEGLDYWTSQVDSGAMTLEQVAETFSTYTYEQVAEADALHAPKTITESLQTVTDLFSSLGLTAEQSDLDYWTGKLESGAMTIEDITTALGGAEVKPPPVSDTVQAVKDLYTSINRTTIDQEGLDYWVGQIDSGAMTLEQVTAAFSQYTPAEVAAADQEASGVITPPAEQPLTPVNPYIPTEIQTGTSYLTPETSVADQMTGLLAEDSPWMQSITNRVQEEMSARGLLDSSIQTEATERARIDAAFQIASQDAQTATLFQQQQQAADTAATRDLWQNEYNMFKELIVQNILVGNIDREIAANLEQTVLQLDSENVRSLNDNLTKLSQQLSVDRTNISTNQDLNDDDKELALADLDADYNRNVANLTTGYSASISTGTFTWSVGDSVAAGGSETDSDWDIDDYSIGDLEEIANKEPQREDYPDDFLYDQAYSRYLAQYPGIEDFMENPLLFYGPARVVNNLL